METTQLCESGPRVTKLCFGCWSMGGAGKFGWANIDDNESISAVHRALELGINFFDNAGLYGNGHAELVLGEALKDFHRDEVVIATKCGVWMTEEGMTRNSKPDQIKKDCEDSLRRLNTDYIDIFQIHWPDVNVRFDESMRAMLDLVDAGKVRYVGVSNYSVNQMEASMKAGRITTCQPMYNMLHREAENDVLPFCEENGIAVMAYSPLASGILAGKYRADTIFGEGDWRPLHNPDFQGEHFKRNLRIVDQIRSIAEKYGKSVAQLSIAWVLMHPAVDVAIVGLKNPMQVESIIGATGWNIENQDMIQINEILSQA